MPAVFGLGMPSEQVQVRSGTISSEVRVRGCAGVLVETVMAAAAAPGERVDDELLACWLHA